jgi:predicted type IV restriction endonuclease
MAIDKEIKKAFIDARGMVEAIIQCDANEADTRSRIEHFLKSLAGYDRFTHITSEYRVHGIGDSDYCDLAIKIEQGEKVKPIILVEIKKVNVDLSDKHVKQAASYGINVGCEWILLTNAREWRLYHITFGQPPEAIPLTSWNLMNDDITLLVERFDLISLKNVKKGSLAQFWQKNNALTAQNLLKIILSEPSISMIRRELKRREKIALYPEEIVNGIRRLLNESAMSELENMKISLVRKQKPIAPKSSSECTTPETLTENRK